MREKTGDVDVDFTAAATSESDDAEDADES
jgi:hypothetical protein